MSFSQSLYISFHVRPTLISTSSEMVGKLPQIHATVLRTCNGAQKIRRILTEMIVGSYDYDCMHHLRNVWFWGMEKKLTVSLNMRRRQHTNIYQDPQTCLV
jgi:hypothetical protein